MSAIESRLRRAAPALSDLDVAAAVRDDVLHRVEERWGAGAPRPDAGHRRFRAGSALAVTAMVLVLITGVVVVAARRPAAGPSKPVDVPRPAPTPRALQTPSLEPHPAEDTQWHIRELRHVPQAKRAGARAPSAVGLESWFYGCTSRTIITSSSDPAMIAWELGGMASLDTTDGTWYVGYIYDPVANVIYVGDAPHGTHGWWHTCGLGLRGYAQTIPGGQAYLARHGTRLTAPPDPARVDPRVAHPGARLRHMRWETMNAIYRRAFHVNPYALGP